MVSLDDMADYRNEVQIKSQLSVPQAHHQLRVLPASDENFVVEMLV